MRRTRVTASALLLSIVLLLPAAAAQHGTQFNASRTAWIGGYLGADGACDEDGLCTYVYYCRITGGGNNLGGVIGCRDPAGVSQGSGVYDGGLTGDKSYTIWLPWIDTCQRGEREDSTLDMVAYNHPVLEGLLPGGEATKALHDFSWQCGIDLRPRGPE